MFRNFLLFLGLLSSNLVISQSNIRISNPTISQILKGNYNPQSYALSNGSVDHQDIICKIQKEVNTDSLQSYLETLATFYNRHTYSDTTSNTIGIGAARRWSYQQFSRFGKNFNNRLIPAYLTFDYPKGSCGDAFSLRNVMAVLPGTDTSQKSIVILEAHIDSRCEDPCDVNCLAEGIEDNGSGTALILELARVMTQFNFNQTIVFMLTVGEEQGLYGAKAMAEYCSDNEIQIKAVLNNDVIGGIRCGKTSSPPSCEAEGDIDSLQVRIFSDGGLTAPHRNLARTIALYYNEKLKPNTTVPMEVSVMDVEDRTGRGGDHIPFRIKGYPSIRFTAANEHGDAHPDDDYTDRQHSSRDILGMDNNGDNVLDEYYVDFNYLKRNTVINGMSATLLASGPPTPEFIVHDEPTGLRVEITNGFSDQYRIGVRSLTADQGFDAIYRTNQTTFVVPSLKASTAYKICVAGIDGAGIMSPFSGEVVKINDVSTAFATTDNLNLTINCDAVGIDRNKLKGNAFIMECFPNPNNGLFTISIKSSTDFNNTKALLTITDMQGRAIQWLPFDFHKGMVEVKFDIPLSSGHYIYSISIDGIPIESKKLSVQ